MIDDYTEKLLPWHREWVTEIESVVFIERSVHTAINHFSAFDRTLRTNVIYPPWFLPCHSDDERDMGNARY
jgi:hypothetical protein